MILERMKEKTTSYVFLEYIPNILQSAGPSSDYREQQKKDPFHAQTTRKETNGLTLNRGQNYGSFLLFFDDDVMSFPSSLSRNFQRPSNF